MNSDLEQLTEDDPQAHPQLTYDGYTEDGVEERELLFVVGVLGDLAGTAPLPPIEQREFVTVTADNFNVVMRQVGPRIQINVPNSLAEDNSQLNIQLSFQSIDDFAPASVAKQIRPLKELLSLRDRLANLRHDLAANPQLDELLHDLLTDREKLDRVKEEEGIT